MNEIRYVDVFIARSRVFKLNARCMFFYQAANAVLGKSAEQHQKRLLCNWSWANVYRFRFIHSEP